MRSQFFGQRRLARLARASNQHDAGIRQGFPDARLDEARIHVRTLQLPGFSGG